jgi:hypothetical protein
MAARTPLTFELHMSEVVGMCASKWLVLSRPTVLGDEYIITPKLCKSNFCPVCRAQNLIRLRHALLTSLRKHRWRLVTLTYPDHSKDLLDQLRNTALQFKRFVQRIRRRYPKLQFVRTIELHESDFPHLHMIVDRYIPEAFLQKHWHDLGGGWVDIRAYRKCPVCGIRGKCLHVPKPKPLTYHEAAHYLTEEIEKAMQDPHRLGLTYWLARVRSITTSRNLKLRPASSQWKYNGVYDELYQAMWPYELNKQLAATHDRPAMTIHDGRSAIYLGYGFPDNETS